MAYDKVVDSSVLDAGLKQIADAIREKAGISDNLAFPTAMAEAIAAIQAGEGGGGGKMVTGTITNSGTRQTMTIEHGLGVTPTIVFIALTPGLILANTTSNHFISFVLYENGNSWYCYNYPKTSAQSYTTGDDTSITVSTIDENTFTTSITAVLRKFASHTYMWLAFAEG